MNQSIAEQIAGFTVRLDAGQIPDSVFEAVKLHILDTAGVAILSSRTAPTSEYMRRMVTSADSTPECTLWGSTDRVQLTDAVLCNGTVIHGLDFDDTHTGAITHPSASILPVAFAVGEKLRKSGLEIMTAAVAGYEVIVRLGLAANGGFHDAGFHPSGILAPFAGVCVAGKLMGCDEKTITNALGIAGSQAGTIMEFLHDGSLVKMLHPGWGALSSIYAIRCAQSGFTGPKTVFEGQYGVFPIHIGDCRDLEERIATLGSQWLTPDIAFKLYPTCHHTHSFIDILNRLMEEQQFDAEDIEAIEARGTAMCASQVCNPKEVKVRPETECMMKFSLYYVLAMTALHRKITDEEINLEYAKDPRVLALIDRITFITDNTIAVPGHMPGRLKVTLKDGRVLTGRQDYEKCARENPILPEDVIRKYEGCVDGILSRDNRIALQEMCLNFDHLNNVYAFLTAMADI